MCCVCVEFVCFFSSPPSGARTHRYERVIPLLRGGRGVRVRLLALRLLGAAAAAAARRLFGPLLQTPLVQVDRLPAVYLQLLGVGLLVPALAGYVVSPAALYPLPQPLHHRAVLRYSHHARGGRVHGVVDADTAVGSGSGGGEVPHRWAEWLLFWKNFSPSQAQRHRHLLLLPPPPPPPSVLFLCASSAGRKVPSSRAASGRYGRRRRQQPGGGLKGCGALSHMAEEPPSLLLRLFPSAEQKQHKARVRPKQAPKLNPTIKPLPRRWQQLLGKTNKKKKHTTQQHSEGVSGQRRSHAQKASRGGAAAAAAATVHSPVHRAGLGEKVLLPKPSGLRSFPVNLHLIWFRFERNPGEEVVELGAKRPSVVRPSRTDGAERGYGEAVAEVCSHCLPPATITTIRSASPPCQRSDIRTGV